MGKAFAGLYDPVMWVGEQLGMRNRRRQLLVQARGRTLEIGAGTGLNLEHYPAGIDELILVEPDAAMRRSIERRMRGLERRGGDRGHVHVRLLDASAERLPLPDASVDTVACTFVLCTVDSPQLALAEIVRVLRPQGQLLFVEHVRSEVHTLARWQDRLVDPWRRLAAGCRCNRDTAALMSAAGLQLELRKETWRAAPPIVRPLIVGRAILGDTQAMS